MFLFVVGFLLNTFLLHSMNNKSSTYGEEKEAQPSKYTESNINQIGSAVPVVLGRTLIKNPLVSFYGDFEAIPYTEEYGAHADLDVGAAFWKFLISLIASLIVPNTVVTTGGGGKEVTQGAKNANIIYAVVNFLTWLLVSMLSDHESKTTIQKGFLYYLGWQHIICWSGDKIGIKKLWMNVYDSELEQSTMSGVWNSDIATIEDNPAGIIAHIDDDQMFGGPDEGGGFIGDIRLYFGGYGQSKDPWMIDQMTKSENIPQELKGLTPLYPMYFTCVVPKAYIGKQATIPEMWFEIANYPNHLTQISGDIRQYKFNERMKAFWREVLNFMSGMDASVQSLMSPYLTNIENHGTDYINGGATTLATIKQDLDDAYNNFPPTDRDQFGAARANLYNLVDHGVWTFDKIGEDLNPAEAIYEILTNKYWGCGYEGDRIDLDSLVDVGITCEQEWLGVSILINQVGQAKDFINNIMTHINGVHFDNPMTGKLTFKLIRNDFDPGAIKRFDVSNCKSCEFSRLDWSEVISTLSVKFTNASDKYNTGELMVYDLANRIITGSYAAKQIDGSYFTTAHAARWMAQTHLMSAGYPLAMVNLECNRYGFDTLIGDPIIVNWEPYGISKQIFRVIDVDYASLTNGIIRISAVEDVFSFDKTDYAFSDSPVWTEPEKEPFDIARYLFLELPYEVTFSLDTSAIAFAAQPSNYTIYWDVWRYANGTYNISAKSSSWSICARFVYGAYDSYDFDPLGFEIAPVGVNSEAEIDNKISIINNDPSTFNHTTTANLLVADNEVMSYDSIVKLPNGHYQIKGVARGIYDTVPKSHSAESIIFFGDYSLNINSGSIIAREGNYKEEQVEIRTETADKAQEFNLALVEHYYTTRRSEQPSIMANLKLAADKGTETMFYYHIPTTQKMSYDILFSFIGRNKFYMPGIIEQTDNTTHIEVDDSTQNVLQVSCNGVDFEYKWDARNSALNQNETGFRLEWADFCKELGNKVADSNTTMLTIKTYNKDKKIYSYDEYKKTINYVVPRLVGIVQNVNDAQTLADSLVQPSLNSIVLPATSRSPQLTLTFDDCPLIFIGTPNTSPSQVIWGQDGLSYNLTTEAYRIDGYDNNGKAIGHRVDIKEEFVFRTNYTTLISNRSDYFRYRGGTYITYLPY